MAELILLTDEPCFRPPPSFPESNESLFYRDSVWCFERFASFLTATAWRWKQGHALPDKRAWDLIVDVLGVERGGLWRDEYHVWDAATMLYYFYSRSKLVSATAQWQGYTGYTGILQEMIAEVPTRGIDRLQRKLSLDFNWFIPEFVGWGHRNEMRSIAQKLANQYGLQLTLPDPPPTPPPKTVSWREWVDSIFGFEQARQSLGDEESRGEKEKLIEGLEREESEGRE